MKIATLALGYLAAIAFALIAYSQFGDIRALRDQLSAVEQANTNLRADVDSNLMRRIDLENQVAQLDDQIQAMEGSLGRLQSDNPAAPAVAENNSEAASKEEVVNANPESNEGNEAFRRIFRNLNSPENAKRLARYTVSAQYGEFMDSLNLSPEDRERLEALFIEHTAEQSERGMRLLSGESSQEEIGGLLNPQSQEVALADKLAEVLTPAQLDQFNEYQKTANARNLRRTYEMSARMQAPGLSDDNRRRMVDTVVREMSSINETDFVGRPEAASDVIATQIAKLENVRRELDGTMDGEQMNMVNNFLDQQAMQLEMASELMKGMLDRNKDRE